MPSFFRLTMLAGLLVVCPSLAAAVDQIPWAPTLAAAQQAATEQGKLVLVHFYNDHCPPCERVEQEVFTHPGVGQAVSRNFVPVKVHAGKEPKVAEQFHVDRWPTDIICTPAGLEIMRTTSPQRPEAYVNLINQVALQSGVGAGRQWQASMQTAGQQVLDPHVAQAQAVASEAGQAAQGYLQQSATAAQGIANQAASQAQGYGNEAASTFGAYAAQANRWNQQAGAAAQQAGSTAQQLGNSAQQIGNTAQQMSANFQKSAQDLRAAWNAGAAPPATGPTGATSAYAQFAPSPSGASSAPGAATAAVPIPSQANPISVTPTLPSLPTANPFVTQPSGTSPPAAASAPAEASPPVASPMGTAPTPAGNVALPLDAPAAAPQVNTPAPSAAGAAAVGPQTPRLDRLASGMSSTPASGSNLVPASQAPPTALEGYCPVTLIELGKWQRANPQFGAIHRGRTYLFASEVEQRKFLADPDAFSPVLSGCDPVAFSQRGEMVEGKRSYGVKYQRQIFLFADGASLEAFARSPKTFADQARQAMHGPNDGSRLR